MLFLVISWQPVFQLSNIVFFKINQQSIVQKYCINRNNKAKRCNGNCHLNIKLHQNEKTGSNAALPETLKMLTLEYIPGQSEPIVNVNKGAEQSVYGSGYSKEKSGFPCRVFHPPVLV